MTAQIRKIFALSLLAFAILQVALAQGAASNLTKATVEVIFEAGCSGCMAFFANTLRPIYYPLKSIMELVFVPFGLSVSAYWDKYDQYGFICQHGPEECRTNMFMACAVENVEDYDRLVDLVLCMMGYEFKLYGAFTSWEFCSALAGVNEDELYSSCVATEKGVKASLNMENITHSLPYIFPGTPWVIVNGEAGPLVNSIINDKDLFEAYICNSVAQEYWPPRCFKVTQRQTLKQLCRGNYEK